MGKKLNTYVHAVERDDQGNTTRSQVLGPDDTVPGWAQKAITNPDVWADESDEDTDDGDTTEGSGEPPRAGKGSGLEAWRTYAQAQGISVPDDANRDDIIAAVDAQK